MSQPARRSRRRNERQRGQALVIFALSLVGLLAMAGLVLDGGGAFAQRRAGQDASDLAAVAGASAYLNTLAQGQPQGQAVSTAIERAREVAADNGFDDADANVTVSVNVAAAEVGGRTLVTVTITKPHDNAFAGVIGQPSWEVTTEATAATGYPNAAMGAMPIIFNVRALGYANGHDPGAINLYNEPSNDPNYPKDVPQDETQFNWTVFCTASGSECNGNSDTVGDLIDQHGYDTIVTLGARIGPLNAGTHNTLFGAMQRWIGTEFPVAIVDSAGNMMGWAMFWLTDIEGGSQKLLEGYFRSGLNATSLSIVNCGCPGGYYGSYVVELVD